MRRGDIVIVSAPGAYGKPRPAVVIQSNALRDADSVRVSLLTTDMTEAPLYRLMVRPTVANGLATSSQVMVDKIVALPRTTCGDPIGSLDQRAMIALNHMLAVIIGIAD